MFLASIGIAQERRKKEAKEQTSKAIQTILNRLLHANSDSKHGMYYNLFTIVDRRCVAFWDLIFNLMVRVYARPTFQAFYPTYSQTYQYNIINIWVCVCVYVCFVIRMHTIPQDPHRKCHHAKIVRRPSLLRFFTKKSIPINWTVVRMYASRVRLCSLYGRKYIGNDSIGLTGQTIYY